MWTVQSGDADAILYTFKRDARTVKVVQVCRADTLPSEEYGTTGYVAFVGYVELDDPKLAEALDGMDYVRTARGIAYAYDGKPIADAGTPVYASCVAEALWHVGAQSDVHEQAGACALALTAWAMNVKLACDAPPSASPRAPYRVVFHEPGHKPTAVGEHSELSDALRDACKRAKGNKDTHYAWDIRDATGRVVVPMGHTPDDFEKDSWP